MAEVDAPRARAKRSTSRPCADDRVRQFPNRADLISALVESGRIQDEEDLLRNHPEMISDLFFNWIAHGQTACQFATVFARSDPVERKWLSVAVLDHDDDIGHQLNALLDPAFDEREVVQFIFPRLSSPEEIADLVARLCRDPKWWWSDYGNFESYVLVGLRWTVPSGRYCAATLGFADLDCMPFTRRSPYAAIVLRVMKPTGGDRWEEDGVPAIHLADMPSGLSQQMTDKYWAATQRLKKDLLAGELLDAARARITFCLPEATRGILPEPRWVAPPPGSGS